jgi:hypothetical protein
MLSSEEPKRTRLIDIVTTSAPEASKTARSCAEEAYLPVPVKRRELKVRSAMRSEATVVLQLETALTCPAHATKSIMTSPALIHGLLAPVGPNGRWLR